MFLEVKDKKTEKAEKPKKKKVQPVESKFTPMDSFDNANIQARK